MPHEPIIDPVAYVPLAGRTLSRTEPCDVRSGLRFYPDVIYFHFVPLDSVSEWRPFIIENVGTINVGIADVDIVGPEFEMRGSVPTSLQPGEQVTLEVRFRPEHDGIHLGAVEVEAGTEDKQPRVTLIGIGGTLSGMIDGDPALIEQIVNDFLSNKWAYRYASFAVDSILSNEILLDYHVTSEHVIQPNFAGCGFSVSTPPALEFVMKVYKNETEIGQVIAQPDGLIDSLTLGGLAVGVPVGSIMTVRAPAATDELIKRVRLTFIGLVN